MRVVVIGDSLSLPRNEAGQDIPWERTWPYLVREHLRTAHPTLELVTRSQRARTARELDPHENVTLLRPDVVIVQVGVVDASPRVFSRRQRRILSSWLVPPALRDRIVRYAAENRGRLVGRAPLAKVYTPPAAYERGMRRLRDLVLPAAVRQTIVVPTLVAPALSRRAPAYDCNLDIYNAILVDVWGASVLGDAETRGLRCDDAFVPDGIHLSVAGNATLASAIAARIEAEAAEKTGGRR